MKSFVKVAAVGLSGLVAFKIATALVMPLLGMLMFLILLTVKIALVVAIGYFVYSLLCKKRDGVEVHDVDEDGSAYEAAEEVEIEIEVDDSTGADDPS